MTLGSHQTTIGKSQVHLTPRWIIDRLGPFDLDPCAALPRPWDCAARNISEAEDGLAHAWEGRVWLNPPFDRRQVGRWMGRLADHGRGTALVHARTETDWFRPAWGKASAILFMFNRLTFCDSQGEPTKAFEKKTGKWRPANSGAPPVLIAFGDEDAARLRSSGIPGAFVISWGQQ